MALSKGYPPSSVTAWSYLLGACMMLVTATAISSDCAAVAFICPPPGGDSDGAEFSCGSHRTSCAQRESSSQSPDPRARAVPPCPARAVPEVDSSHLSLQVRGVARAGERGRHVT